MNRRMLKTVIAIFFCAPFFLSGGNVFGQSVQDLLNAQDQAKPEDLKGTIDYDLAGKEIQNKSVTGVGGVLIKRQGAENTLGMGFFVGGGNMLLTAAHYIGAEKGATVRTNDGRLLRGHVESVYESVDLALIRVEPGGNPCLQIGRSASLVKGVTLGLVCWPEFSLVAPKPLSTQALQQELRGFLFLLPVLKENKQVVKTTQYWEGVRTLFAMGIDAQPEWAGSPLLDEHGQVVAILMSAPASKKPDRAATRNMPYRVEVDLFGGQLPPIILMSDTEPPEWKPSSADRDRQANYWRTWLLKAKVLKVPKINLDGGPVPIAQDFAAVERALSAAGGRATDEMKISQSPPGQAGQRGVMSNLVNWMFRANPNYPVKVSSQLNEIPIQETSPVPIPKAGQAYAIPIAAAKQVLPDVLK